MTRRLAVVVAMSCALYAATASGVGTDRLAIELLSSESAWDAAFEYERACWKLGAEVTYAAPVQLFDAAAGRFARLEVEGDELAMRCLEALEPPRRGVDGRLQWFDGFEGGALVPGDARVPDGDWYDPESRIDLPAPDQVLVDALARGDAEALQQAMALSAPQSLALVGLVANRGASALPSLEQLAAGHPHWLVRREAVLALDPGLSFEALSTRAHADERWEVRHAAVAMVAAAAAGPLPAAAPHAREATRALESALQGDADWRVRRQVVWHLPSTTAAQLSKSLVSLAREDPEPQVRAAAIETLAGAELLPEGMALQTLSDPSEVVRAVSAYVLTVLFEPAYAPLLWQAMRADSRPVRLAAAPMLARIETAGLGPELWAMYLEEAQHVDARQDSLQILGDALARADYEPLGEQLSQRLSQPLAPGERRLVARLLARVAPERALQVLSPLASSADDVERSIAAHALPDTPETRTQRVALLEDDSALVRAGAVLGLCQVKGFAFAPDQLATLNLPPVGLGRAATMALPRCGVPDPARVFLSVSLEAKKTTAGGDGTFPAVVAMAIVLLSVVGIKLRGDRPSAGGVADDDQRG